MEIVKTPGQILSEGLANIKEQNSRYSLRALARDVGINPGNLSVILRGKSIPSKPLALKIAQKMDFSSEELRELERSVVWYRKIKNSDIEILNSLLEENNASTKLQYRKLSKAKFEVLSQWYHLPILDLTTCSNFVSDPKWIARRLNLKVEEVVEAIEYLKNEGLLIEENGKLAKKERDVSFTSNSSTHMIRNYHQIMMTKACDEMYQNTDQDDFQKVFYQSQEIKSS